MALYSCTLLLNRRTVYDEKNDREVVLTKEDLKIIRQIKAGKSPSATYDPYPVVFLFPSSSSPSPCPFSGRVGSLLACPSFSQWERPAQELWEMDDKPSIHPVTNKPPAKSQFVPSKWEAQRVAYLVRAIKKGWIDPNKSSTKEKPRFYDIWSDDKQDFKRHPLPLTVSRSSLFLPLLSKTPNPLILFAVWTTGTQATTPWA